MKCSICGESNTDGTKFCEFCGATISHENTTMILDTPIEQEPSITPVTPITPIEQEPSITPVTPITPIGYTSKPAQTPFSLNYSESSSDENEIALSGTADTSNPDAFNESEQIVESESVFESISPQYINQTDGTVVNQNKSKIFLFAGVIAGIIIILAILGFAFYPSIVMAITSPQEYYMLQEKNNFEEFVETFDNLLAPLPAYNAVGDITINLESSLDFDQEIFDLINKLSSDFNISADDSKMLSKTEMALLYDGKEFLTSLIETDDKYMSIGFLGVDGKIVEPNTVQQTLANNENEILAMTGMTSEELNELGTEYFNLVFIDAFPEESIKKGKGVYEDISCSTVEFKFNSTSIKSMAKALGTQLTTDREKMVKVLQTAVTYHQIKSENSVNPLNMNLGYSPVDLNDAEIATMYDEIVESLMELSEFPESNDSNSFNYTVYYNKQGKLIARELLLPKSEDGKITMGTHEANGEIIETMDFDFLYDGIKITNTYSEKNSIYTGIVNFSADELSEQITCEYSLDMNTEIAGIPIPTGIITIDVSSLASIDGNNKFILTLIVDNPADDTMLATVGMTADMYGDTVSFDMIFNTIISDKIDLSGIDIPAETTMSDDDLLNFTSDVVNGFLEVLGENF